MAADVKRMLIINDNERLGKVDLSKLGIEAGWAYDAAAGLEILNAWAKQGRPADLVTIDSRKEIPGSNDEIVGGRYLRAIEDWAEQQPEMLRPKKYFLHSGIRTPHPSYAGLHDVSELGNIDSFAGDQPQHIGPTYSWDLSKYLNQEWGTGLPTSKDEVRALVLSAGKISPCRIAEDVDKGTYTERQVLKGLDLESVFTRPGIDPSSYKAAEREYFEFGTRSAAVGHLAFDAREVHELHARGKKVILAVNELTPEHMKLLSEIEGAIVLGKGTQHSKYVFEAHGKTAFFDNSDGALAIKEIEGKKYLCRPASEKKVAYQLAAGDEVSLDRGEFFHTGLPLVVPDIKEYAEIVEWAKKTCALHGGLQVKANADTAGQVKTAIESGADGIGLLRTEHMFFTPEKLPVLQRVLKASGSSRAEALREFAAVQQNDFQAVLEAAKGNKPFPLTVRLLDAPAEEFLSGAELEAFKKTYGRDDRGAGLAQRYPGLYQAQARALFEAAKASGYEGALEIMVPLVRSAEELAKIRREVDDAARKAGFEGKWHFGAMIETQDAVRNAAAIAGQCDFLSFGTNDLTEETTGCKRNDISKTQEWMRTHKSISVSPFRSLSAPVLEQMREAVRKARMVKPSIVIGVCGDQVAGDYASIHACQEMGLGSISVPPTAASLTEARLMAGKACASHLPPEILAQRLPEVPEAGPQGFVDRLSSDRDRSEERKFP